MLREVAGGAWGRRRARRGDEGPVCAVGIILSYPCRLQKEETSVLRPGPRELDRVLAGRVSLLLGVGPCPWAIYYSTSSPRRTSSLHGRGEAEAAPQLEPRSQHSVTLRVARQYFAKPRNNPAYPQPVCILVVPDGDSAHGGSGSDLCRQTCSGPEATYLLPAGRIT